MICKIKNMKKFIKYSFVLALFLIAQFSYAAGGHINFTVKNNSNVVYSDNLALPGVGMIDINDTGGSPHSVNARSVLDMVNVADAASPEFNISNLIYYSSFNAFYLKCITVSGDTLCDNWQYKVNGDTPGVGMDKNILFGGENVVLFFKVENVKPVSIVQKKNWFSWIGRFFGAIFGF